MTASLILALTLLAASWQDPADKKEEFLNSWQEAMEVNDREALDRALRRNKDVAIEIFMLKAATRSMYPTTELDNWVNAFVMSWDRTFRSSFASNYDRYLQRLDPTRRSARRALLTENFPVLARLHTDCVNAPDDADWAKLRRDAERFNTQITQTGELYYLAFGHYFLGNAWNTLYDRENGDDHKSLEAYEAFLYAREQLDLKVDTAYPQIKSAVDQLRAKLGIADPETGIVAEVEVDPYEIPEAEESEWELVVLEAGHDDGARAPQHPSDLADDNRMSWFMASVGKVDEERQLPYLDPPVMIRRVSMLECVLVAGADPSKPFRIGPRPVVVEYERKHEDGSTSPHAVLLSSGSERDPFQGVEFNFNPQEAGATIFFRSIATRSAKTSFGDLTIYDLNGDGRFGYEELGMTGAWGVTPEDRPVHRYDALLLGKGRHSLPFSRWFQDAKGQWYELKMDEHAKGTTVNLRKAAPRTGSIKVSMKGLKGVKLASLVLIPQTRQIKGLAVDVMAGSGSTYTVPIGRYDLQQGLLVGKKGQEALLFPDDNFPFIEVEEGETAEIELGSPFKLAGEARLEGKALIVDGLSLHVVGRSGERYMRFVGEPLRDIEASVKGAKSAKMRAPSLEDMNALWKRCYFPSDVRIQLSRAEMRPVQLVLKKHPWFGKLTGVIGEP